MTDIYHELADAQKPERDKLLAERQEVIDRLRSGNLIKIRLDDGLTCRKITWAGTRHIVPTHAVDYLFNRGMLKEKDRKGFLIARFTICDPQRNAIDEIAEKAAKRRIAEARGHKVERDYNAELEEIVEATRGLVKEKFKLPTIKLGRAAAPDGPLSDATIEDYL